MQVIRIVSVKPVQGSTDTSSNVVIKYEVETNYGDKLHLEFTSAAANALKGFLDTPVRSMRLGEGGPKS